MRGSRSIQESGVRMNSDQWNKQIDEMILRLSDKLAAEMLGDGGTYTTAPATEPEPLTFESLQRAIAALGPPSPPPVKLIEVEPYPIYGPARQHRKRRIHKKWLKRYGQKVVGYEYPMGDSVIVDEKRGIGYCHPHTARIIRRRTLDFNQNYHEFTTPEEIPLVVKAG